MIRTDKLNNALYALQGVLIRARSLAYEGAPHEKLATILDAAEYLPFLIASKIDETDTFRACIANVATEFSCGYVLSRFDEPAPPGW